MITAIQRDDLPSVLVIEKSNSQEANPVGGIWTRNDFKSVLQMPNHEGFVAWRKNVIVGFAIYCFYQDKIHISNMAVHPDYLRRGIGTEIINRLKGLQSQRRPKLECDLRESNLRGQLFLKANGFKAISVIRNWYEQPRVEDAYKFQCGENYVDVNK